MRIDGSSVGDADYLVLVNRGALELAFEVETPDAGTEWRRIVDTAHRAEAAANCWALDEGAVASDEHVAKAMSIVAFKAAPVRTR